MSDATGSAEGLAARRGVLPVRWLLSPGADLTFLVGSVLVSYALLLLWSSGRLSLMSLIALWVFVLHGPHFWGTISRTFLDPGEWRERGPVLKRSLLWFLVGPAMVGAGVLLKNATGYEDLILLFFFLAALWAFHHVIKQHFGFVALYRAKHKEFDKGGFTFLKWYLLISMWMPVAAVLVGAHSWFTQIPLAMVWGRRVGEQAVVSTVESIGVFCMAVFWLAQAVFALYLVRQLVTGRGLNLPVLLIVLASVPLNYFVADACLVASRAALAEGTGIPEAYAFVPLVTSYHNIQYHALNLALQPPQVHARGRRPARPGLLGQSLVPGVRALRRGLHADHDRHRVLPLQRLRPGGLRPRHPRRRDPGGRHLGLLLPALLRRRPHLARAQRREPAARAGVRETEGLGREPGRATYV